MKFLSRSEEMILLSILRLRDNAYVVTIQEELKKITGETWALGALFVTLDRMTRKGFVQSRFSKPIPERGGRRKRLYKMTSSAVEALNEVRKLQASMWRDISALSEEDFV